jgi:GNAT superfamily N-acetyltransferase
VTLPVRLTVRGMPTEIRRATAADVPAIVALLVDDVLGHGREDPVDPLPYERAFALVDADPAHALVVAELAGEVVGTLQLSILPGLSRRGALRGQVEGVRVAGDVRGRGIGSALLGWAVDEARRRSCSLVQLTTDAARADAHRFYGRAGFAATHVGFKLDLASL